VSSRSSSREHLLRLTPAVLAAAIALDVLAALAPALLPGARGSAAALTFLVLPSVVVAGYGSRRLISVQSVVVVASCGVVVLTAADPSVPTAATAIAVTAAILAAATVVVVLRRALERAAAEARTQAILDPLTAAVNRRGLEDAAVALLHDGRRRAQTVGAIMLDVDDFKSINDAFATRRGTGSSRRSAPRSGRACGRRTSWRGFGGEEFAS
jgi:predicted signal transduction protein with EAL and GGDEF domain